MRSKRTKPTVYRVRFATPDGMFTFADISHAGGQPMTAQDAKKWGLAQVKAHPERYASVAKVYPVTDAPGG